uniref:Uncharacterized protein n=1 Tax=Anguilla anguilla TaxID=7936 RepID=A0A0E9R388_ANGAN
MYDFNPFKNIFDISCSRCDLWYVSRVRKTQPSHCSSLSFYPHCICT